MRKASTFVTPTEEPVVEEADGIEMAEVVATGADQKLYNFRVHHLGHWKPIVEGAFGKAVGCFLFNPARSP